MITEAEYNENMKYAEMLLTETCRNVRKACGSRAAGKLRKRLNNLFTITQEECDSESWRAMIRSLTAVSVIHMIENRILYSNREYRERFTPDSVREICRICGLRDCDTEKIIQKNILPGQRLTTGGQGPTRDAAPH